MGNPVLQANTDRRETRTGSDHRRWTTVTTIVRFAIAAGSQNIYTSNYK